MGLVFGEIFRILRLALNRSIKSKKDQIPPAINKSCPETAAETFLNQAKNIQNCKLTDLTQTLLLNTSTCPVCNNIE
jgi:hypothetical protein